MKHTILFLLLLSTCSAYQDHIKNYEETFLAIEKEREGLSNAEIVSLDDPFSLTRSVTTVETSISDENIGTKTYVLYAIINNSVNINNKWYKKGDIIDNYKVKSINTNMVNLEKDGQYIKLNLRKKGIDNAIIEFSK